jgi:preprotein translocase subunit Sec63
MTHLEVLGLDEYASMDDVKSAYRRLAKEYHPDLNKNGVEKFREVKFSYEWLVKNHIPKKKLRSTVGYDNYYELLTDKQVYVSIYVYHNDGDTLDNGIVVNLMKQSREYRVFVEKGTTIPTTLVLTNVDPSITIDLKFKV